MLNRNFYLYKNHTVVEVIKINGGLQMPTLVETL